MERVPGLTIRQLAKESLKILFVSKETLSAVPPTDDMVQSAGKMNPRSTSHKRHISKNILHVNNELPKPDPK